MNPAPLDGLRVVEMGRVMAAPFCGQMLGDMGADVIKVEMPPGGDESRSYGPHNFGGVGYYFASLNRNKRGLSLNLKEDGAKEILRRLLRDADVFIHNSLPRAVDGLGFSYEHARDINPRLVYCSINGYGARGPNKNTPALDMIAQAGSGLMSVTGPPEGPPFRSGAPVADLTAGMYSAYAILGALRQRDLTGRGQQVDTSLLEAATSLMTYMASHHFITGDNPRRMGNAHPSIVPYDTYPTADGWVAIAVVNAGTWRRFCGALGLGHLVGDERFAAIPDRAGNRAALDDVLVERFATMTSKDLVLALRGADVPCEAVRTLDQVFADDNSVAIGLRADFEHPKAGPMSAVNTPYHLADWPDTIQKPPPALGEHNAEILRDLGYSVDEIASFRTSGAI
ncbi:MAG: CoA transferase [Dehalococcoidia bacterium]|nr:CoA transferase [Dehalococcoidia bacterium]